ncbi:hypothetical protein SH1V18_03900 [Vallitalea longa]|uniref:Uncharacterized protein n=1 Tax=Vallitalea longa TaxID=2936439 RepID=A0A9W5Y791_9FIRM|nr:hypothetical protein [Vallitalea longa]GKX27910.1 hypothetical protein SH1V18_03900 [Vallitalea longa]
MINIDNIGNLKKCRVWLNKLPSSNDEIVKTLSSTIDSCDNNARNNQNIALELFVAPRYYGFLGIEYIYKESKKLEINVHITGDSIRSVNDSLALPSDNVYCGISSEYAPTILDTATKVLKDLNIIPSGTLNFNIGNYSDYGSNQVIFSKITSILIRLLGIEKCTLDEEECKNIVRNELNKSLTNI